MSLPRGGYREDAIRLKMFSDYIRDNADIWFNWSRSVDLPVERMDDLILVTGCTMVNSWAAAVFDDYNADAQVSLGSKTLNNGGATFVWSNIRGTVEYHDSQLEPVCFLLDSFTRRALTFSFSFTKRLIHPYLRIDASLSGASEQSASFSGPDQCELQQNPTATTATTLKTVETVKFRRAEFHMPQK